MNIDDPMSTQLETLAKLLDETSQLHATELGSVWPTRSEQLGRYALYVRTFIIPDVRQEEALTPRIATFEPPERKELGPLAKALVDRLEVEARDPAEGTGTPFPIGNGAKP